MNRHLRIMLTAEQDALIRRSLDMFHHFIIKNFRCFAGLHLRNLARINLIAGKNNTGKTAMLEALQMHNNPSDPSLPILINQRRGIVEPLDGVHEVCSWLFWNRLPEAALAGWETCTYDEKGINRTLQVYILDAVTARERFPKAEELFLQAWRGHENASKTQLILRYQQPGVEDQFSVAVWEAGGSRRGWSGMTARIPWNMPSIYLASAPQPADQDTNFFAELEANKREQEILPALQIIEPRLNRLALLPLAGQLTLQGDIGLSRLVPIPFMGEGVRRLTSIVLAIANAPGGVVLIDEIENGLHYSVQQQVWQAIAVAARKVNVQVFATTHSYECIRAAHEAFEQDKNKGGDYDFRLHRLDRIGEGIQVSSYDQDTLETALELAHEVR